MYPTYKQSSGLILAKRSILAVLAVASLPVLWAFVQTVHFELQGGLTADSPIYWAVGRGIVNGLVPYRDLFETKPPGIFLLSGASIWLFGNLTLGYIVQALSIFSLCGVCAYLAYSVAEGESKDRQLLYALVGFLFGAIIAFYSSWRSGLYQIESFGASFAVLYIAAIYKQHRLTRARFAVATVAMGLSLGFKEPFLLTIAASAMLLSQSLKEFYRLFVQPLAAALVLGTVALFALGYLGAYVEIYLIGEMLSNLIHGAGINAEPTWKRAMDIPRVWRDITDFAPPLGYALALLSAGYLYFRLRFAEKWSAVVSTVGLFALTVYMTSFTIGLGAFYYNHHFVFGVPFYVSLFLVALYDLHHRWQTGPVRLWLVPVSVLCIMAFSHVPQKTHNFAADIAHQRRDIDRAEYAAIQIDTILDRCHKDRYLFLGPNGVHPFGYTRHSPIGPVFFQLRHMMSEEREYFREQFAKSILEAEFIVFDSLHVNDMDGTVMHFIETRFTKEPWECAGQYGTPEKYTFYFKK